VHGGAGDRDAVLERLLLRVLAGERRQQRRMNIEDRVRKRRTNPAPSLRMKPARQTSVAPHSRIAATRAWSNMSRDA
jgi:hypothetical protein